MDHSSILTRYTASSGDHYAVARETGISPHDVMKIVRAAEYHPADGLQFIVPTRPRPALPGRAELRRKIISIRHQDEPGWPVEDRAVIEQARSRYEAGLVEMAQARVGGWVIQYVFPRERPVKPNAHRAFWFMPAREPN